MRFALRFFAYPGALALAYYVVLSSARQTQGSFEGNDTFWMELPQELILVVIVGLHAYLIYRSQVGRTFNILFGGLALSSLIREHNNQLAELFDFHQAWAVGAVPVAIATAIYVFVNRQKLLAEFHAVRDTFGFGVLLIGLAFLHVFTRLFGANDLWHATMGENYLRVVARTVEEGTELAAYTIILLGTVELVRTWMGLQSAANATAAR